MSRRGIGSGLERRFLSKMADQWRTAAPGVVVQAYHGDKKILDVAVGDTYPYYDFASLTKIVFTNTAFMLLHDRKLFHLDNPISYHVPWYPESSPWRVRDLMCHSAGLKWWYPFYKDVAKKTTARTSPEDAWLVFQKILKSRVLKDLKKRPKSEGPRRPPKAVYSDLDLFMLGIALENIANRSLFEVWCWVREYLGLSETDFHRGNRPLQARTMYAPTENDRTWRKKVLRGEVHDQNTWALRGVAPHAGLFGTIGDLSRWGLGLRAALRDEAGNRFPSMKTVRLFTRRQIPRKRGDWALGFMMPSKGSASCGELFSAASIGHTGFTGTSLWFDPKQDLLVAILSNRVHPTVENIEIRKLRPLIHTWIAEEL